MKKFNIKLTIALVSLFIGVVFLAFVGINIKFLSPACFLSAFSCIFFGLNRADIMNETIRLTDQDLNNEDNEEIVAQVQLEKKRYLKKSKKALTTFYLCAGLLVVVAILVLIR